MTAINSKYKVVVYSKEYFTELTWLVQDYFKETLKDSYVGNQAVATNFVSSYLDKDHYIYLVVDDNNVVVGFVIMYVFNMYGFSKEYLVVDHMYILPDYRGTKATLWLFTTIGKVMNDLGLGAMGVVYADSSNKANSQLIGGKVIAQVTEYRLDKIQKHYKRYLKRLKAL